MESGVDVEGMTIRTRVADTVDELQEALADDAAFERWYRAALPRVFGYLMARTGGDVELSEELTQQTFVAAIDQRARFDRRSDSATWLCGIARHKLADSFRKRGRDDRRQVRMEVHEIELAAGPDASRLDLGEREQIEQALAALPAAQRAILTFVALDDLSVAEAGRLLGKSPLAAQSLLHRARETFRRTYRGTDR
jgi:RNA polymerase sigma-70 factor (ECF subfamily)